MTENDYKNFITVYQQKSADFFAQIVALEARIITSNQMIEAMSAKISQQNAEIETLKAAKSTRKTTKDNSSSEEF